MLRGWHNQTDAVALYVLLVDMHGHIHGKRFALDFTAMREAGLTDLSIPRLRVARRTLEVVGLLKLVEKHKAGSLHQTWALRGSAECGRWTCYGPAATKGRNYHLENVGLKCDTLAKLDFNSATFVDSVGNNFIDCNQFTRPKQHLVFILPAMSDYGVCACFKSIYELRVLFSEPVTNLSHNASFHS
jgi:hypothetical protein